MIVVVLVVILSLSLSLPVSLLHTHTHTHLFDGLLAEVLVHQAGRGQLGGVVVTEGLSKS
jgi:hypothetical protein